MMKANPTFAPAPAQAHADVLRPDTPPDNIQSHDDAAPAEDLLPTEILITLLSLTRPSASLAAACQTTAMIARSHHQRLSWTQFTIFHAPLPDYCSQVGTRAGPRQCDSRLAKFLLSRLPEEPRQTPAMDVEEEDDEDDEVSGERPMVPDEQLIPDSIEQPRIAMVAPLEPVPDPLVTMPFLAWLFSPKGPLHMTKTLSSAELSSTLRSFFDSKHVAESKSSSFPLWSPLRDALQFLDFSMRTGNLGAASLILSQLSRVIPGDCLVPAKHWTYLLLENRSRMLRSVMCLGNESVTFPTFCYWLAALEWSLPLLKLVHAHFDDFSGLRGIMTNVDVHDPDASPLYNSIHSSFINLDDPDRFIPVLTYLRDQAGVDFSMHCMLFLEHKKQYYSSLKALIEFFGLELLNSFDMYEMYGKRMSWIGASMMTWEAEKGITDHLEQIMDLGLYTESAASHALQLAFLRGHDNVVDVLVANLGDDVLGDILVQLLFEDQNFKHPPSARYFTELLSHYGRMMEYGAVRRTPTQELIRAFQKQPFQLWSYMFRLLFEATAPPNAPWDLVKILRAFLKPFVNTAPFNAGSLDGNPSDTDYFAFFGQAVLLVQTPFIARLLMALQETGQLFSTLAKMDAASRYACTMIFFSGVGFACSTETPEAYMLNVRSPLLEATMTTLLTHHPTSKHPTIASMGVRTLASKPKKCPQDEYQLLRCARPSVVCQRWLFPLLVLLDSDLAVSCVEWNKYTPTWVWKAVAHLLPQEDGESGLHFKVYSAAIKGSHRVRWVLVSDEDHKVMVQFVPGWIQRYCEWQRVLDGTWADSEEEDVDENDEDSNTDEDDNSDE
ncbi:hypothetical protein BCR44DRAFT_49332 [Catenaria anguillulae PL171]|uniref:Uncharacterized protein n=1 Tax=Catenaria anguillulae PL171 TaxID=765915 RepID=A0A1Y2I2F7_9FUNG|nr:hypothetical protein BCR44DRAFT_49332 [Catenaria anguillulae PL171]